MSISLAIPKPQFHSQYYTYSCQLIHVFKMQYRLWLSFHFLILHSVAFICVCPGIFYYLHLIPVNLFKKFYSFYFIPLKFTFQERRFWQCQVMKCIFICYSMQIVHLYNLQCILMIAFLCSTLSFSSQ